MVYGEKYINDLEKNVKRIDLSKLNNKSILITGACGLICSYIVDCLAYYNELNNANIKIYALGRNKEKFETRFSKYKDKIIFLEQDVCDKLNLNQMDYIIHGASNANPKLYATDPVGTMTSNFIGMYNVLELAKQCNSKVLYISSSEVYGKSDLNLLKEEDCGYIDSLSFRSCYPNSKRAAETLCASYMQQYNIKYNVVRLCHVYGPTMTNSDNRAVSEFLRNAIASNDICLKSEGLATRSYCYVGDVFTAIMKILLNSEEVGAYNVSNSNAIVSVKELANTIASNANIKVVFDISDTAKLGYTNIDKMVLSSEKLEQFGWMPIYNIQDGIKTTIEIIMEK